MLQGLDNCQHHTFSVYIYIYLSSVVYCWRVAVKLTKLFLGIRDLKLLSWHVGSCIPSLKLCCPAVYLLAICGVDSGLTRHMSFLQPQRALAAQALLLGTFLGTESAVHAENSCFDYLHVFIPSVGS